MEFKGTKCKWHILEFLDAYVIQDGCTYESNEILNWNEVTEQEAKANALLISKAPEMLEQHIKDLEILEKVSNQLNELGDSLWDEVLESIAIKKQLIQQATKID